MTKEEIVKIIDDIADDYAQTESELHRLKFRLHELISQAIAEHEASQWKKYDSDMQLENAKRYIVQTEKFGIMMCSWHSPAWIEGNVIAFRELPKPYKEGGER